MKAINTAGLVDQPFPVEDTLFFKIQGDPSSIQNTSKAVRSIAKKHGSSRFEFASTEQEADDLWQNRKYALMSTLAAYPGTRCWTTDVCVPVSCLPQLVYETKKDLAESGVQGTIVGHVGDGTGEHGVGVGKKEYLIEELGEGTVELMWIIKRAVDPDNLFNPGKLYPASKKSEGVPKK
ncbi:hypothetical protein C0989_002146 [Termitomyces sp. Mn162]|nr:hypothetical protein C0989_002146 [Termitomyces sp. Mn162]